MGAAGNVSWVGEVRLGDGNGAACVVDGYLLGLILGVCGRKREVPIFWFAFLSRFRCHAA